VEEQLYATYTGYRDNNYLPHVFRSNDNGNTWVDITANLPQVPVNDIWIAPARQDSVLFVGTDAGVYATVDAGQNWHRLGVNLPLVAVFDLELNEGELRLMAGTYARSIVSYPLEEILPELSVAISAPTVAGRPAVLSAGPSPADDVLLVQLEGSGYQRVVLEVYDMQGRCVMRRNEWPVQATTLDLSGLSTGMYVVSVVAGSKRWSSKFIKR
jgi:hypothetical protein